MTRERQLPDDDPSRWIRALPETWAQAAEPRSADEVERLVTEIVTGARDRRLRSRIRRRRIGLASVVFIGSAGVAVGAAALLRSEQPTRPNDAVICRAEAKTPSDAVGLDASRDPVAACADAWARGVAPLPTSGDVPELTGCVNAAGGVDVIPGPPSICADLGLVLLDQPLSTENDAILSLQELLIAAINAQPCAPSAEVKARAERILEEEGFADWIVEVPSEAETSRCAKVAIRANERVVDVFVGL